jgi:hypothetical protein
MHWKREHGTRTTYTIACETCGDQHQSARPDGRFCSDDCKGVAYRIENRRTSRELVHVGPPAPVTWLPAKHPAMRHTPTRKPRVWYAGNCAWCGDSFTDWQPASRYCSPLCGRRASRSHSRKRKGYPKLCLTQVERINIYVRDAWTCQLCLDPVDSDLMSTAPNDDWAPSLDHIVTRVSGGSDEPDNLRLAHRWCNSVRSDETYYTQDMLRISHVA